MSRPGERIHEYRAARGIELEAVLKPLLSRQQVAHKRGGRRRRSGRQLAADRERTLALEDFLSFGSPASPRRGVGSPNPHSDRPPEWGYVANG
jgi:hypothetical protein